MLSLMNSDDYGKDELATQSLITKHQVQSICALPDYERTSDQTPLQRNSHAEAFQEYFMEQGYILS